MKKEFCAGIDIGGTKISSALFTRDGEIAARSKVPIDKAGGDATAEQVAGIVAEMESLAGKNGGRLSAAALCIPGVVYQKTGLVWAPNIPEWDHYPLGARIAAVRGGKARLPVLIESDRSACVLGEQWLGVAKGAKDAVFLAVGTGIGAGIIAGGRVLHGAEDIAGAVGWFALNPNFKDEYAAMGCFEAEASGNSVGRKAGRALRAGRPTLMRELAGGDPGAVTAEIVAAAARKKDFLAQNLLGETVTYLGMGIANIVSILNPEIVVLGGGLFQASDLLLEPVRREFRRWAQPLAAQAVRIEVSTLGEDAGLVGCGKLAWDGIEGPAKTRKET
jgi:glucokinase